MTTYLVVFLQNIKIVIKFPICAIWPAHIIRKIKPFKKSYEEFNTISFLHINFTCPFTFLFSFRNPKLLHFGSILPIQTLTQELALSRARASPTSRLEVWYFLRQIYRDTCVDTIWVHIFGVNLRYVDIPCACCLSTLHLFLLNYVYKCGLLYIVYPRQCLCLLCGHSVQDKKECVYCEVRNKS